MVYFVRTSYTILYIINKDICIKRCPYKDFVYSQHTISILMVYYVLTNNKGVYMNDITSIKVRKSTVELLKKLGVDRKRRETLEQVILALVAEQGGTSGK